VIARRDAFDKACAACSRKGWRPASSRGDPKLLAFALFGAVNWIPRWYSPDGPASSQAIREPVR
jgi:TetR/AcrR family transcriptional regulator